MLNFESDYIAGAHPKVMEALAFTNLQPQSGYGSDEYCKSAREKIKKACNSDIADVWFLAGGTQTNTIAISSVLKSYQGVICAPSGHIFTHEAGAIENTGHKVIEISGKSGKIDLNELKRYLENFYSDDNSEHMVFPGMVYISHPTEYGTLYSKKELEALSDICKTYKMSLYLDGARLAYGLMSNKTDVTLEDIARLCDVFYIGGTKVGALCGEALVFTNNNTPEHFLNFIKKKTALLAKSRLLGVQFDTLFTDNLYFEIGKHAVKLSEKLKQVFIDKGYRLFIDSPTNQQFLILNNDKMKELSSKVVFSFWEKYDEDHTVVRFATGFSTTDDDIEKLKLLL